MKIEQLKTEVSDISTSLNNLKNDVKLSEEEKKKQAEALKTKAEETKKKIDDRIKELSDKTDADSKKEVEEGKQLLETLDNITNLQREIIEGKRNPETTGGGTTGREVATGDGGGTAGKPEEKEEKGVIGKSWDRIKEQRNETTRENFKEKPGITLLRGVGFAATGVGALTLAYKGVKKLFGRGKKEEGEEEEVEETPKKKKKKKSFRKKPFGKFLKRTAVGAASVLGIHSLGKRLGRWGTEGATGRDSDKDKYNSYDEFAEKPENKEKFDNYEGLGGKVDSVYQEIYNRELQSGYEDELEMKKIAEEQSKGTKFYKGIVPYCLDNQFKTVEGILGQNSSFKTALYNGLDGMVNFVKSTGEDFLKLFSEFYLEYLPSWAPFKGMAGSLSDKIDQRKIKNKNAEKEMQYFFRQSIRVQTYLFEKRDQLARKLIKEAAKKYGKTEDEIRKDKDLFDKYIIKDPQYQNFLNSPTHSAVTVLSQNNLFDNHIDEEMKKHVVEIDEDRNKILGCKNGEKDIIQTINGKKEKSETLDSNDDKKLGEACDGMITSMDNIIEAAEEGAWNNWEELFRSGDANLREYLEKSGLDKMFESYKQIILDKKQELISGKLSNEKKIELAETINSMLALKKEAELGKITIEKDYDEFGNIIYRIPGFLASSVKNLKKGVEKLIGGEWKEGIEYLTSGALGSGVLVTATGAVMLLSKNTRGIGKTLVTIGTVPISVPAKLAYKKAMSIAPMRDFAHKINPFKYRGNNGAATLLKDLADGKVSLERATKIINRKSFGFFSGNTRETREKTFNITEAMKNGSSEDLQKATFDAMIDKIAKEKPSSLDAFQEIRKMRDQLIKQWDTSPDIRRAVINGDISSVKKTLGTTGETVDVLSPARKAFNKCIDNAVGKLKELPGNHAITNHIDNLKALKNDLALTDDEMEGFVKFVDQGFDAKLIPELKKLFIIENGTEKVGEKLKKLIQEGKYDEFKRILNDGAYKKVFKTINVEGIIKNFDNILKKAASTAVDSAKLFIKAFKVIAKVL